jgi:HD-GYP domain-containing protein (c-di-GMP phosphodiesterase class II)
VATPPAPARPWPWRRSSRPARDLDPLADGLIEQSRARRTERLASRELLASVAVGGTFLAAASVLAASYPGHRSPSFFTIVALLAAYAVASQVEFEVGAGWAVPTQLVLVPMLFLLPVSTVPLAVAAGLLLGEVASHPWRRVRPERAVALPAFAWHAVGPAAVLLAAGSPAPTLNHWPIFLLALAAQFVFDLGSSAAREWIAFGVAPRAQLRFMAIVWTVDAALAPVGLAAAIAARAERYADLLVVPLFALLAAFAAQRRRSVDQALELGAAYRGTAFLLGDVIEADDSYTGSHSRDVVTLTLAVAEALGLDAGRCRDAELTALLHDVGKIRISKDLVNKPGALTAGERAVMETHTIEGEALLSQVGGLLGEVGQIVRSCHERYDGGGYPDGLAGEEIPLIARIVSCCDAFSAMTTDRPYRAALSLSTAIAELEAQAGSQFDPAVVAALVRVVGDSA